MIHLQHLSGDTVRGRLDALADLRIRVFRDFPYLYDGDVGYEREYLEKYASSASSVFVLALDGDQVVGAATGLPLVDADPAFQRPFEAAGMAVESIFYFGESVLDSAYRGQGLGHRFFDGRERFAADQGYATTAFCAVVRPDDHPLRPPGYRPLDAFWRARGYAPAPGMQTMYRWRDLGEKHETEKTMQFWLRH